MISINKSWVEMEFWGLLIILLITVQTNLFAQGPDTIWTKTFGGSEDEYGFSVQKTTDEGYIITGFTRSYGTGYTDVWLIKTDPSGDTLWTKTFGGNGSEEAYSVQQTAESGYIIVGITTSYGAGNNDLWLIKTDPLGDTLWTKTYGGSHYDEGYSVQQTADGGYIIVGITRSYGAGSNDVWLLKTDAAGDTIWTKTFGGNDDDGGTTVKQTTDQGYIIVGITRSYGAGSNDVWLIKTGPLGDTIWTKTFGGSDSDYGSSVQQTADGGYIIVGITRSYGAGSNDVWLIKTGPLGDTVWTKTFGGSQGDEGYSVQQTADGGYIIVGATASYGAGSYDIWLIKTDPLGDTVWTKTFGGSQGDEGYSVQQTADGGYIIVGATASYGAGSYDIWLIKTEPAGTVLENKTTSEYCTFSLKGNPTKGKAVFHLAIPKDAVITLRIYDVSGRLIDMPVSGMKSAGFYEILWTSNVSNGVYFYYFEAPWQKKTGKLVLLR